MATETGAQTGSSPTEKRRQISVANARVAEVGVRAENYHDKTVENSAKVGENQQRGEQSGES
jgi:hypothetical protein